MRGMPQTGVCFGGGASNVLTLALVSGSDEKSAASFRILASARLQRSGPPVDTPSGR